jgi:hypothetical protein
MKWKVLEKEMKEYEKGKTSYLMTLNWMVVTWQIFSVGIIFSNVIGTLALPVVPVFAVAFFHDKLDGAKVIALLAI